MAIFLPDSELAKRLAGVAAGLKGRQEYDEGAWLGASSKLSPTLGNCEDQEPPPGLPCPSCDSQGPLNDLSIFVCLPGGIRT